MKSRCQIEDRIDNVQFTGHFGDHKCVDTDDDIWELKWRNGRRVYYKELPNILLKELVLLLGGNKNGQNKAIKKSKSIFNKGKFFKRISPMEKAYTNGILVE